MIRTIKEYKIVKPDSMWSYKDDTFEELFNKNALEGWEVHSVSYGESGTILKALLVRNKKV